jgi:hypothetical protein
LGVGGGALARLHDSLISTDILFVRCKSGFSPTPRSLISTDIIRALQVGLSDSYKLPNTRTLCR